MIRKLQRIALLADGARIPYELRLSPRRRTLAIEVHPDLRVIVRAPDGADERWIAGHVAGRGRWIGRTLELYRGRGAEPSRQPRFVSGATHEYLGERYRLQVDRAQRDGVSVVADGICVTLRGEATPERVRTALEAWYRERALEAGNEIIEERFGVFRRWGHQRPSLRIRKMTRRWGSLAGRRRMTLNLALIRAPRPCIEYVVVHELCHLEHSGHGAGFYRLMDELMPDWRSRRQRLEAMSR